MLPSHSGRQGHRPTAGTPTAAAAGGPSPTAAPTGQTPDGRSVRPLPAGSAPASAAARTAATAGQPASKVEAIQRLLAGADAAQLQALQTFVAKEHSEENLAFLAEVNRVTAHKGGFVGGRLEAQQALFDGFIREGAPLQVNLSSPNRARVERSLQGAQQALARGENMGPPMEALDQAFTQAYEEIIKLVAADTFDRFLAARQAKG